MVCRWIKSCLWGTFRPCKASVICFVLPALCCLSSVCLSLQLLEACIFVWSSPLGAICRSYNEKMLEYNFVGNFFQVWNRYSYIGSGHSGSQERGCFLSEHRAQLLLVPEKGRLWDRGIKYPWSTHGWSCGVNIESTGRKWCRGRYGNSSKWQRASLLERGAQLFHLDYS